MSSQITIKETFHAVKELEKTVAKLEAWSVATEKTLDRLGLDEIRDRLARLESKTELIEKRLDEGRGRYWDLAKLVIAALVGGTVTIIVQYVLSRFSK